LTRLSLGKDRIFGGKLQKWILRRGLNKYVEIIQSMVPKADGKSEIVASWHKLRLAEWLQKSEDGSVPQWQIVQNPIMM
jgi:hypothetical protein